MGQEIISKFQQVTTCGNYENEKDAVSRLGYLLNKAGIFNVFNEVWGDYEYRPHYKDSAKRPRIDMLLTPTIQLIKSGWTYGAIGIECKKSETKIGKPISQIFDYSTAIFRHPSYNVLIKPDFYFLWPCEKTHGDIASMMAQNRFGSVLETGVGTDWHSLDFFCGEQRVFSYRFNRTPNLEINKNEFGKRTGSR